jgi:hypothetical protein
MNTGASVANYCYASIERWMLVLLHQNVYTVTVVSSTLGSRFDLSLEPKRYLEQPPLFYRQFIGDIQRINIYSINQGQLFNAMIFEKVPFAFSLPVSSKSQSEVNVREPLMYAKISTRVANTVAGRSYQRQHAGAESFVYIRSRNTRSKKKF